MTFSHEIGESILAGITWMSATLASLALVATSAPLPLSATARRSMRGLVCVVDDDAAIRQSLHWLIESSGHTVQTYSSAQEFLDRYDATQAGCLVLDLRMPGMGGLELQDILAQRKINVPVIMITGHGELADAVKAMKNGAVDFLEKPFNDQALLACIETALGRDEKDRKAGAERARVLQRMQTLTGREGQVLDLVATGMPNKQIATKLGISDKTVEFHRARVMHKLEARNVAELVRMVLLLRREE